MLVLSRKVGEVITIGTSVTVTVLSFDRGVIRLGIEAPRDIPVHRKEVYDKIIELNLQSSKTDVSKFREILELQGVKLNDQEIDKLRTSTLNFSSDDEELDLK